MPNRPIVYLAGAIAGLRGFEATDWRREAADQLSVRCIETLDPMRGKGILGGPGRISLDFQDYASFGHFFTSRAIMVRDFTDVKRCDALLVNLRTAERPSLGTVMELAWAYAFQKPAVVVTEDDGNPHDGHPMLHEAISFRVSTLEEGIDAVAVVLGR